MNRVPIDFDEESAHKIALTSKSPLELTLPEHLDESVWERLKVIKELTYPLPIIVTFSPNWLQSDLEKILTRLAASFVSGIALKESIDKPLFSQISRANNLGLSIIHN